MNTATREYGHSLPVTGNDIAFALETLQGCGFQIVAPPGIHDMRPIACAIFGIEQHHENFSIPAVENLATAIANASKDQQERPATFVQGTGGQWEPKILGALEPWAEAYRENFYFYREQDRAVLINAGAIYLSGSPAPSGFDSQGEPAHIGV